MIIIHKLSLLFSKKVSGTIYKTPINDFSCPKSNNLIIVYE